MVMAQKAARQKRLQFPQKRRVIFVVMVRLVLTIHVFFLSCA
jgi:hypothetical protein